MKEDPLAPSDYRQLLVPLLVAPILLLGVVAWMAHRTWVETGRAVARMEDAQETRALLRGVIELLADMETGSRGFILTEQEEFLASYVSAEEQLAPLLRELGRRTADDPVLHGQMPALRTRIEDKVDHLAANLIAMRRGQRQEAADLLVAGEGLRRMNAVRQAVAALRDRQNVRLEESRAGLDASLRRGQWVSYAVLGLQVLLCAAIAVLYRRMTRLHAMVTMCAWSHTVQYEGQWLSFEEYLRQRFGIGTSHGISPDEMEKFQQQVRRMQGSSSGKGGSGRTG